MKMHGILASVCAVAGAASAQHVTFRTVLANASRASDLNTTQGVD